MSDMKTELSELKQRNQEQQSRIADLSHTGSWCAYRYSWTSGSAVVKYDNPPSKIRPGVAMLARWAGMTKKSTQWK